MALSVISASSERRSPKGVSSSTAGFDNLLATANRRFSAASTSSSSSSSTASSVPYNSKAAAQQAQDLRVLPSQQQHPPPVANRRRKAPEDYVDEHEDLEVRDGRLMCKYCSLVIGAARNPSGSNNNNDGADSAGLSRSSRIREHLQSKRHVVQKQLQLMNVVATSTTPSTTQSSVSPFLTSQLLSNPTAAVDLLMSSAKQSFFDNMPSSATGGGGFQGLLEGAASLGGVGAVGQLTSALKSAACVIDAEICDIDERIGQLQMQIDQLRAKKAKLAGHKSEINRSLGGVSSSAGQTSSTPSIDNKNRSAVAPSPLPGNLLSALPTFTPNFGQLRTAGDILQELTSSFVSPQFNSTTFSAILASAAESATALLAASQQQQSQQQIQGKPLHSLLSSVIDASQAEDSSTSLTEPPTGKNATEQDSGNASGDDNGLLCLSLAAAAATPQPTESASSGGTTGGGGSRRKTLKPTRLAARHNHQNTEASNLNDGTSSTTPTDLSFPNGDDQANNINRLLAVSTPCDEDSPLSLVKYEQRDQSVFPNATGVHSPFTSAIVDDNNRADEVDRPTTPEIQQYNPALADKRFRGKAVQYCLLRRFNDHEVYSNWIRLQKVTRDKRTDTETGVKDFFRCPYARKIGWQPCPFRMYALFRPDAPGQITVFRSEVDHYHAQLPSDASSGGHGASNNNYGDANVINNNMSSEDGGDGTRMSGRANAMLISSNNSSSSHSEAIEPCD